MYIPPYSARSYSKVLYNIMYNIIIPESDLFPPNTYFNSQGSIQRITIASCQVLICLWMNERVAIAAHGASNPRPGYEYAIFFDLSTIYQHRIAFLYSSY